MERNVCAPGGQALWRARWLTVLALALVMLLDLLTYERGHAIMQGYMAALVFGMLGICLLRGDYRADRVYWVGLAFAAWYALTRVLNGDHYLQYDYNQYRVVSLLATYGLAFPFAAMQDDACKRRALDRIAAVLTLALSAVSWLGVAAAFRGEVITVPFFNSQFGIMSDGRLYVLSQHPNFTAAVCICGMMMLIYLLAAHWRPWRLIPAAIVGAGFFIALPLSDSRTGMVAFMLGLVIAAIVGFQRLPLPARWRRVIEVVCLVVIVAVVAVAGFGAAVRMVTSATDGEQAISQRSLLSFGTFLSRTRAYAAVPGTFAQHPSALLKGFDELEMMAEVNRNTDVAFLYSHMHNAYLQTLMLTGVPGLLMALWLSWRIISSAFRVLFARDSGIAPTQKLLISLPAALFLQAMLEHYLFVDNYSILNFLFFLFSGYLVQLARGVTWKQVFPFLARRKKA